MFSHHFESGEIRLIKFLQAAALALMLTACASTDSVDDNGSGTAQSVSQTAVEDPFESYNRQIFTFNYNLDKWLLKPVAKGYDAITPQIVQTGVGNFFSNLKEISNTANDVLQWKWGQAGNDSGRFIINSTIGIAGLFDVATKVGLPRSEGEDFGQTMAVWGVDAGPYLMLPLLGPGTIRDTIGSVPEALANPVRYVEPTAAENSLRALDIIDSRASVLQTESLISGDAYSLLRDFYLQRRNYLINDGKVEDDFGGGYGDDSYGDYESYDNYETYDGGSDSEDGTLEDPTAEDPTAEDPIDSE